MESVPEYLCRRIKGPITIDGDIDKAVWREIRPFPPFQLYDGSAPASRQTLAKACWDGEFLYFAFDCEDPDIWGTMRERDDPIYQEEVVEIFLSFPGELTTYYEFEVSPHNVVFDTLIRNPTGRREEWTSNIAWNCRGLKTAVRVFGTLDDRTDMDERWQVEVAIPFAALLEREGASVRAGDMWRGNVYRIDRTPTPEFSAWSPPFGPSFHMPQRFGKLMFVEDGV